MLRPGFLWGRDHGPGEPIWSYLSDHMRSSGHPGWRLLVPCWLATGVVPLAFATVFK